MSLITIVFSVVLLRRDDALRAIPKRVPRRRPVIGGLTVSIGGPCFVPLIVALIVDFKLVTCRSILKLCLSGRFTTAPRRVTVVIASAKIVDIVIRLFMISQIIGGFKRKGMLGVFLTITTSNFLISLFTKDCTLFFFVSLVVFLTASVLHPILAALVSGVTNGRRKFTVKVGGTCVDVKGMLKPAVTNMLCSIRVACPFILNLTLLVIALYVAVT